MNTLEKINHEVSLLSKDMQVDVLNYIKTLKAESMDSETAYLMKSANNAKHLQRSIKQNHTNKMLKQKLHI